MLKRIQILLLISLLAWPAVRGQDIVVEASLDSSLIWIGNPTTMRLSVSAPRDVPVEFPAFESDTIVQGIQVLRQSPVDTVLLDNDRLRLRKYYLLTSFDAALYYIPPIQLKAGGKNYESGHLSLKVISFEVDTASMELFDIKGIEKPPFVIWDYALPIGLVLGIALLLLLTYYLYKRFYKSGGVKEAEPDPELLLPPHVAALQALDRIKSEKIWTEGKYKLFYTQLTDVLRKYMERRFEISAMELSSSEILDFFRKNRDAQPIYEALKQLLMLADFVKFAKFQPLESENQKALNHAYDFVDKTKPEEPLNTESEPNPKASTPLQDRESV
ncbi:MAG: hypothetical protein PHE04_01175 [Bacteroidales bacterium]|nr:hypothetical protein [Bacteroidales bacterium]MDD3431268.1 hypothetical protein [Bacteroidales bacterium]MDD4360877.1 hypothetical protein [Bacteroidales bacterium]